MIDFLNMIYMAEDDGSGDGGQADPVEQPEEQPQFTQKQLNDLLAKQKGDAQAALLKKLGVDSFDDVKEGLAKFKELQMQGKSKAEQLELQNQELAKQLEELSSGKNSAESKLAALSKGVDPEKLDRALKLANAYDGDTADDKIEAMLKEFPELRKQEGTADVPRITVGGKTSNPGVSESEQERNMLKSIFLGKK